MRRYSGLPCERIRLSQRQPREDERIMEAPEFANGCGAEERGVEENEKM